MKFLNKIKYSTVLFSAFFGMLCTVSCDDLVDESAISEIDPNNFFRNNNDALGAVVGIYDAMQPAFRVNHFYWGEFRADNYINNNPSANADNIELTTNNITSGNTPVLRWNSLYDMINRANYAIENIPNIDNFDANLLAEAQVLRAYAYFQAIRVWGAVPLFTEPVRGSGPELQKVRTDATTIMNQVILPDMLAAEENMTLLTNPIRFSLTSIWAFQAEVYGYLGDYEKVRTALDKIVASNEFSLVTTPQAWQDLFLNDIGDGSGPSKVQRGSELMMSLTFNLAEAPGPGNANRSGIFSVFFAGLPSFNISPELERKWRTKFPVDSIGWEAKYPNTNPALTTVNSFGDQLFVYGDFRYFFSREGGINIASKGQGNARLAKYNKFNYSVALDDSDIVIYRYANIILYLAEAENRLNNSTRALALVNQIRTARQLPLVTAAEFGATVEERETYILDERQIELLGEAQRWWDLRRTNRTLQVMNPILDTLNRGVPLTQERLLFPIFDEHLIENPKLTQTPGY